MLGWMSRVTKLDRIKNKHIRGSVYEQWVNWKNEGEQTKVVWIC